MSLVYVTGPTGAGKSALRALLVERGYEAHDTDEDGIANWFNRHTGERADYPERLSDRTERWVARHEFLMSRSRVEELRARGKTSAVFLLGIPGNGLDMTDLYDEIVCLVIDKATMLQRVESRTGNTFGRTAAERDLIVRHRQPTIDACREAGAILVDATRPLGTVADEILALATRRASEQ